MQGDLLSYLKKRYEESDSRKGPGPVITLSREYGCPSKIIAQKLSEILSELKNKRGEKHIWKWYSKEILDESARQLQMDPSQIKYVFDYEKKGALEDIFSSFSQKYYKSDRKIRNTIGNVIREIGIQGNAIIVGRGGIAITRDIADSLHVNLEAPLDWRAVRISEKYCLTLEKAKEAAIDIDKKRQEFREYFQGKNNDYTRFDVSFNCMTLSVDEIVKTIVALAEMRGFIR
jgi:cytidylate kinase